MAELPHEDPTRARVVSTTSRMDQYGSKNSASAIGRKDRRIGRRSCAIDGQSAIHLSCRAMESSDDEPWLEVRTDHTAANSSR